MLNDISNISGDSWILKSEDSKGTPDLGFKIPVFQITPLKSTISGEYAGDEVTCKRRYKKCLGILTVNAKSRNTNAGRSL